MALNSSANAAPATKDYAVLVSAAVQSNPAQITLSWPQDSSAVPASYEVSRKLSTEQTWTVLSTLSGNETTFSDQTIVPHTKYEYQVKKVAVGYTGYGYVMAGSEIPLREERGNLILVVDNTYAADLASELSRLQQDLVGDGWQVIRHDVNRTDTPAAVKNLIKADYEADPANVRAVFLFGHVPVPYSGDIVPDGHNPNHRGAWPADVYYADIDHTWSDSVITSTNATDARQHNRPGDGKFDFSTATMLADLEVGRVDLANLPQFALSERELLRQYLNKDHNFRHKIISAKPQGLVADSFGTFNGSAFAATGWRNFAACFGASNVVATTDWYGTLTNETYLAAYGCGGGTFTSVEGVTTTAQLAAHDPGAIFTFLFGSYFGDWDTTNNVMRAALATPTYTLTSAWAGRPHWFVHHMGLGETIGYSTRLTQINNTSASYKQINPGSQQIHIALMGDPALRLHPVAPPTAAAAQANGTEIALSWTDSAEPVLGYHIYRATHDAGPYTRITSSLVTTNEFTDPGLTTGVYTYMIRAVRLEVSASGSYYNGSQGAFVTATLNDTPPLHITTVADQIVELGLNWSFTPPEVSGGCSPVTLGIVGTTTNPGPGGTFSATCIWQATDACGNSMQAAQSVTVNDTTPPSVIRPADRTVELGSAWTFDQPTATDLSGAVTINVVNAVTNSAHGAALTATCSWNVADALGNTAHTAQVVTILDTTVPTLIPAKDKTMTEGLAWTFDPPIATDASGEVTLTELNVVTNTDVTGFTATCTWRATDPSGNASHCSQNVRVQIAGPVAVGIVALTEFAYEDGETVAFEFARAGSALKPVTLKLQYSGTAEYGVDYSGMPAEVVIPAGMTSVTLNLVAEADSRTEKPETVTVTIRGGEGYDFVTHPTATINLFDTTQKRKSHGLIRPGRP